MIDGILGKSRLLESAIDASVLRNDAISQNIANVDTPNYKRKTVAFEEFLHSETGKFVGRRTHERHIPIGIGSTKTPTIMIREDYADNEMRLDGNNVDIDSEMTDLAKNQIRYNVLIQRLNGHFSKFRHVISEGRR
jgi:flagellar basal-body rod protein FlgB